MNALSEVDLSLQGVVEGAIRRSGLIACRDNGFYVAPKRMRPLDKWNSEYLDKLELFERSLKEAGVKKYSTTILRTLTESSRLADPTGFSWRIVPDGQGGLAEPSNGSWIFLYLGRGLGWSMVCWSDFSI